MQKMPFKEEMDTILMGLESELNSAGPVVSEVPEKIEIVTMTTTDETAIVIVTVTETETETEAAEGATVAAAEVVGAADPFATAISACA